MPNGLLSDDSLRAHPDGLALSLTLPWYRSLWLSSVGTLRVTIDGAPVDPADADLRTRGRALRARRASAAERGALVPAGAPAADREAGAARRPRGDPRRRDLRRAAPAVHADRARSGRRPRDVRPEHRAPDADADGDRSGCSGTRARHRRAAATRRPPTTTPSSSASRSTRPAAEFRAGWYDFDSLLARVAELGIGPGIEIVASQVLPTYPVVSDEFVRNWRAAFDKYGFDESSFGANLDMGRRRDRDMTPDEEFEFSEVLFRGAKKLGFPLVRIQSAKPELLRRLLPVAEELDLKLAYEIHAPMGPNAPEVMKVRDVYAQLDSPLLGFVADFSSTMHAMSPTLLRAVRRAGLDDASVERMQQIWATDAPMRERQQEFIGYLQSPRLRPGSPRLVRAPRLQHARARRPARVGRHHAADPARARQVLRHRRERPGAGDRLSGTRARVRRGRLPRLLVERVGGPRVRRDAARSTRCCSCASSTT